MNELEEGFSSLSLVAEDYVQRKGVPGGEPKEPVRELTLYQLNYLEKDVMDSCIAIFAYKNKGYANKFEDGRDLKQEGMTLFAYCLSRLDRVKLPEYRYSGKPNQNRKFPLHDKAFRRPEFKSFLNSFIRNQRPLKQLKKTYGEDFEMFLNGALEWLSRQTVARFSRLAVIYLKENRFRQNKARNSRKIHTQNAHLGPEETDHALLEVAQEISPEGILARKYFYSENPDHVLFRDFLEDVRARTKEKDLTVRDVKFLEKSYGDKYEILKNLLIDMYCELGEEVPEFYPELEDEDLISKDFPK